MSNPQGAQPSPGRRLREAWAAEPIMVPGVFNALVARMAERLGFRAVYLSGGALSAATGVPDIGLLTLTEFVSHARTITLATSLPLISDADTEFSIAEPDFTVMSLRSTAVLRWELSPGSTLFIVWQQTRQGSTARAQPLHVAAPDAVTQPGVHSLAIKLSYWFG